MAASAIVLAGALLLAGVPGVVLLALTPGLLCLAMAFVTGHGDPHGEEWFRTPPDGDCQTRFWRLDGPAAVADAGYEADLVSAIVVPASATRGMLGRLFGR